MYLVLLRLVIVTGGGGGSVPALKLGGGHKNNVLRRNRRGELIKSVCAIERRTDYAYPPTPVFRNLVRSRS